MYLFRKLNRKCVKVHHRKYVEKINRAYFLFYCLFPGKNINFLSHTSSKEQIRILCKVHDKTESVRYKKTFISYSEITIMHNQKICPPGIVVDGLAALVEVFKLLSST